MAHLTTGPTRTSPGVTKGVEPECREPVMGGSASPCSLRPCRHWQPLLGNCSVSLHSGPMMGVTAWVVFELSSGSFFHILKNSSWLPLIWLIHANLIVKGSLGASLVFSYFWSTDKLRIFQLFKFYFGLAIPSLRHCSLLECYWRESGENNHNLGTA